MDLFWDLKEGFSFVIGVMPLLTITAGVCIGILIGAMPGLSPSMGVALLVPLFRRPLSWRILDAGIGLLMCGIALALLTGDLG